MLSELLDLFPDPDELQPTREAEPMTEAQRVEIRNLFAALDISTAREQFELVHVLVGARIQSVADLDATKAAALVPRLRKRVESQSRQSTGSSWDDREEDTWIDNL